MNEAPPGRAMLSSVRAAPVAPAACIFAAAANPSPIRCPGSGAPTAPGCRYTAR